MDVGFLVDLWLFLKLQMKSYINGFTYFVMDILGVHSCLSITENRERQSPTFMFHFVKKNLC